MSFKLKIENKFGSFNVELFRELSSSEANDLCHIANNVLAEHRSASINKPNTTVYGPWPEGAHSPIDQNFKRQTKLGERPASLDLGPYKEPKDGVKIKILHMITGDGYIPAIRKIRSETGISLKGSRDIICGNCECPTLSPQSARTILEEFRKHNLHAKIVAADGKDA